MFDTLIRRTTQRPPDFVIGGDDRPYLRRWWLIPRNPFLNVYLHQILRSDDDRALHDHPWASCSIILRGRYLDWTQRRWIQIGEELSAGMIKFRWPTDAHRLELIDDKPCWTLFITGPRVRQWGFLCPQGWKHWKEFTKPGFPGEKGPGCEG